MTLIVLHIYYLGQEQENFKKKFNLGLSLAIDESMVKFKGHSSTKQYLSKNNKKRRQVMGYGSIKLVVAIDLKCTLENLASGNKPW